MFLESIKMALSSVIANKGRSFLTVLGVIIGVGSVLVMFSLGEGVKKSVSELVEGFGTNIIMIVPGKIEKNQPINPSATIGISTLSSDDIEELEKRADKVRDIAPMNLLGGVMEFNGKVSTSAVIISTTPSLNNTINIDIEEGRFINDDDLFQKRKVVVIGSSTKQELFGDKNPIGENVKLRNTDFEIVGYLKSKGDSIQVAGFDMANLTVIPRSTAVDLTGSDQIFRIAMESISSEEIDGAVEQVKSIILENHQNTEDFSVLTQDDLIGIVKSILDILTLLIVSIAAISLVVGGIGIMNMMLVTVTERTREIGIRKAIGAKNREILLQFLIESVVISFIGGLLGVLFAFVAGFFISRFTIIDPVLSFGFIIIAFTISFFVGVIFGLVPALRASKKDTIESLRYE